MTGIVLLVAALVGLVAGALLCIVIDLVPAGIPVVRASRCAHCDAPTGWFRRLPIVSWPAVRGRCPECRAPLCPRAVIIEPVTAVVFAGVTAWAIVAAPGLQIAVTSGRSSTAAVLAAPAFWPVLVAYLFFAAACIALFVIDIGAHRLPNRIVLAAYLGGGILLLTAVALGAPVASLVRGAVGLVVLATLYFVMRLISPRGMGGGDVKLAGALGLFLGWTGWSALVVGALAAFVLGGVFAIILLAARRAERTTAIPFGPWMILGAWGGLLFGSGIADGSLALAG